MPGTVPQGSVPLTPAVTQAELKCLLVILQQSGETGLASTNKIAGELQVKPPTVCKLLEHLLEKQMIFKEPYGKVELTPRGRQAAYFLKNRVEMLQMAVMERLCLSDSTALQTAFFFVCHLSEQSQRRVLEGESADRIADPGTGIIPHTKTEVRQEAVM